MKNWMHHAVRACTVLLAAGVAHTALAASCATSAAPRAVDYPWMSIERWRQMHAEQVARAAQGGIDVMFVGDSLTEMWPKALWDSNFGHLKAANFGIGGDHTGNVLWRLQDPAIAAIKPKLVVLMIGVNNINLCKESADAVFGGIRAVVARLRAQYPAARILLNAVLPAGTAGSDVRRRLVALNRRVRTLNDGETVFFRDYGARFMGADGNLSKELQPDLLHFSEKGYRLLADAMRPDIEQLLAPKPYVAVSPDGRTRLEVTAGEGKLAYTVTRDGATVIAQSPLGLSTSLGTLDGQSLRVDGSDSKVVSETYRPVAGKAASVADHYNEVELRLVGKDQPFKLNVLARAYNDGVALRYMLPKQEQGKDLVIHGERTGFHFPADYQCWGFNPGRHENPHEGEFDPVRASAIRPAHLFDAPLVCKTGVKQTTFAIAEADKRNYAGAYYAGRGEGGLGVQVSLALRRSGADEASWGPPPVHANVAESALATPWRVVMLADTPGGLAASSLVETLGSPSVIGDTSWIKPGKAAWDWWNGWAVNIPNAGVNTATYRAYIDSAAALGLEYILIDEGWYVGASEAPLPGSDVTRPVAAVDMPAIIAYAREKGIGVWLWLQWKQLERQMEQALPLYAAWGIKGIKVDFMDRNDQEMVDFYHKLLGKAAANRLMVNLHGAYPPDGLVRTYPNYMTQEGVLGAEYNKWSKRITATHNVTLPFTRMILGPIDYTPGGFRSLPPSEFAKNIRNTKPFVQTTRGQALAMYVVYDSPLAMVADSPDAYRNADGSWADGAGFLGKVPTTWDETRVIDGDIGQFIVTARRKGRNWYIGAMGNESPRRIEVPLNFVEQGVRYRAEILEDGKDVNRLAAREARVQRGGKITLSLAGSGGAVVVLTPLP